MEWNGSYDQTAASVITHNNTSITTVTTSIAMQLNSSDNGFTFTCKTSFKPTSTKTRIILRPGESCATNVPGYLHVWNFTTIVSCKYSYKLNINNVRLLVLCLLGRFKCLKSPHLSLLGFSFSFLYARPFTIIQSSIICDTGAHTLSLVICGFLFYRTLHLLQNTFYKIKISCF